MGAVTGAVDTAAGTTAGVAACDGAAFRTGTVIGTALCTADGAAAVSTVGSICSGVVTTASEAAGRAAVVDDAGYTTGDCGTRDTDRRGMGDMRCCGTGETRYSAGASGYNTGGRLRCGDGDPR